MAGNPAGKGARDFATQRHILRVCLGLLGILGVFYVHQAGWSVARISALACCLAGLAALDRLLIPVLDWVRVREGNPAPAAKADKSVGALLDRLPEGWVVFHNVTASYGKIDHLVLRADGAVYVIETKSHRGRVSEERSELLLNGKPFDEDLIGQTHASVFWVREFLKGRFGVEPWINAALVFPNASVSVPRTLHGVDVISPLFLDRWLARARGNPEVARKFQRRLDQLKSELLARR